jgi:N-carbamoyl-L-amino-acid hydrolase
VTRTVVNADAPAACSPLVTRAIARSADALQLTSLEMISRAYHDSLFMSRIAAAGMIFIPCRGGISHRPDEYASPEAIARGAEVLAGTLAELAG